MYLAVLPSLPTHAQGDEAAIAADLRCSKCSVFKAAPRICQILGPESDACNICAAVQLHADGSWRLILSCSILSVVIRMLAMLIDHS